MQPLQEHSCDTQRADPRVTQAGTVRCTYVQACKFLCTEPSIDHPSLPNAALLSHLFTVFSDTWYIYVTLVELCISVTKKKMPCTLGKWHMSKSDHPDGPSVSDNLIWHQLRLEGLAVLPNDVVRTQTIFFQWDHEYSVMLHFLAEWSQHELSCLGLDAPPNFPHATTTKGKTSSGSAVCVLIVWPRAKTSVFCHPVQNH